MAYEIERKYIIKMPDTVFLSKIDGCRVSEITQTYLPSAADETARIRKSVEGGKAVFTKTTKHKKSSLTRIEIEDTISEDEYTHLLKCADSERNTLHKTRYTFYIGKQKYEIDVYPFWRHSAICETELESESTVVDFPPFLHILREVTEDKEYSNRAMAKKTPPEDADV